nr:MAG TPA: hypothetical protein [Caudoviricetes sp.]
MDFHFITSFLRGTLIISYLYEYVNTFFKIFL